MKTVNSNSAEWQILKRISLAEIEKHRQELESLTVDPDRAQQLRGMISALRQQIDIVEPSEDPTVKEPNYG